MDAEPRKDKTDEKHVPPYDPLLPPRNLEEMSDWMVEKAIDRAARQIDRNTEGKLDSKLNSLLFMLRAEMRSLLR